jgi:beta-phosphoglucomutase-like phosphatase (HAD superfamily)
MNKKIEFNNYDLFIVDFDGTIVDTMTMWRNICPNFISYMGQQPPEDIFNRITSKTNLEIARYMRDEFFTEYTYDELTEKFFDFIKMEYVKQDIKPNAYKLLSDMAQYGKVVLYSATAGKVLDVLLDKYDLRKYFSNIYSGSDLGLTKRDGTGYLEVIKLEGGCNKALILEDALHAIKGAFSQNLDVLTILDISNQDKLDEVRLYTKYLIDLTQY